MTAFNSLDPGAGLVADRRHAHDLRIGGAEAVEVELGRAFVAVRGDQQHRRAGRQHLDLGQPVVEPALVGVPARVPDQQVERAPGHEELVRGVVDLLAAEVPDVQGQVDAGAAGAGQADGQHVDAVGGGEMWVVVLPAQGPQQRGLAGGAFTDQQQFGFMAHYGGVVQPCQVGAHRSRSLRCDFRRRCTQRLSLRSSSLRFTRPAKECGTLVS